MKFTHEALESARFLNWVEIFALNILDERDLQRSFVGDLANDSRYAAQAGSLRGAPAPFARQKLKPRVKAAQNQRLNDSADLNGLSKLGQRLLTKMGAWLVGAWLDQVDIHELRAS
jgi:hypothetical protein